MTVHNALHPTDDVERLYVSKREGREFASIEGSLAHRYKDSKTTSKKRKGRLITATRKNTNDTKTSGTTMTEKTKVGRKQLNERLID